MTQIFAHRGSASTHPENTMSAFREAARVGADGIELDVQLSSDGEVMVIHDESLKRTTGVEGFVKDRTAAELVQLNAGFIYQKKKVQETIPTLAEVLDWLTGNQLYCMIELKNTRFPYPGLEEKVIHFIQYYQLQNRIILSSFNHYSLVYCHYIAPNIETAPIYREGLYQPWVYAQSMAARGIHPNFRAVPEPIIKASLMAGIAVRPYTINEKPLMKYYFDIGVSGFITDYPKMAVDVRREWYAAKYL